MVFARIPDAAAAVVVVGVALMAASAAAGAVTPCGPWTLYKQCGESWSNDELGTASGVTVCAAGCAMSSVSMALATNGESINGGRADPGSLNKWLTNNGGYADHDLIVWNSVHTLGNMSMVQDTPSMSQSDLVNAIKACHPVIANVRDKSHWVLLTGYDSGDANKFYVNDPGFADEYYMYDGMSSFVEYTNVKADAMPEAAAHTAVQPAPALLRDASAIGA